MVCLGNICRSPLAHGVMQHWVNRTGLDWDIDSAGIGSWHVGEPPDQRAIAVARKYGIDISSQRAQQFQYRHLEVFDYIFAMDRENFRNILAKTQTTEQRLRVNLFLEDDEVPDPYYDNGLFDPVYQMVDKRCRELIEMLKIK